MEFKIFGFISWIFESNYFPKARGSWSLRCLTGIVAPSPSPQIDSLTSSHHHIVYCHHFIIILSLFNKISVVTSILLSFISSYCHNIITTLSISTMIINLSELPALAAATSKASLSRLAAHIVISRGTLTRSLRNHLHHHHQRHHLHCCHHHYHLMYRRATSLPAGGSTVSPVRR